MGENSEAFFSVFIMASRCKKYADVEKIVWHFIRNEYEEKYDRRDVPLSLKYLTMQFSKRMIGCSMLTIEEDLHFYDLLGSKLGKNSIENGFKLLFRASEHDYKPSAFHEICDGQGPTLTIIKSEFGNIFGGYTSIEWTSGPCFKPDKKAFLFLIRSVDKDQKCPRAFDLKDASIFHLKAVFHLKAFGPTFVGIVIQGECNFTECKSYKHDNELCGGPQNEHGRIFFNVEEYEVYKLI